MSNDRIYEQVTQRVIEALEKGTIPWQKPWRGAGGAPRNLVSGRPYSGVNVLLLGLQGYGSPYWLTYKQAAEKGGQVRKGEHGTHIIYFHVKEVQSKTDPEKVEKLFFARSYVVFNLEQVDGIVAPDAGEPLAFEPIEQAHQIIDVAQKEKGLVLKHGGAQAYYNPTGDYVMLPSPDTFRTVEGYYSTAFHELGHWTGGKKRLARDTIAQMSSFGDSNYSKEELVAEMCAGFLAAATGVDVQVVQDNQAAYVANWLKALKGDARLVVSAASQAQKAADLLLDGTSTLDATLKSTANQQHPTGTEPAKEARPMSEKQQTKKASKKTVKTVRKPRMTATAPQKAALTRAKAKLDKAAKAPARKGVAKVYPIDHGRHIVGTAVAKGPAARKDLVEALRTHLAKVGGVPEARLDATAQQAITNILAESKVRGELEAAEGHGMWKAGAKFADFTARVAQKASQVEA